MRAQAGLITTWMLAVLIGNLADRTTGQPLSGVRIALGTAHTVSRPDGSFRLKGVKPGRSTLTVSSDDVPPQHFSVTVGRSNSHVDLRVCSTTLDYNCGLPQ